jgi:pyrroloquinoline quinone biosynthesis protein B
MLHILVLGSAAGGGVPQWNCNCDICEAARAGNGVTPRTQSSLAISANGADWFLLNASPDLREQIAANRALQPRKGNGKRHSPIAGAVLTNGDVDHVAGLLNLRESYPLAVYATPRVHAVLKANAIFNVLNPAMVERRELTLDGHATLATKDGAAFGLTVEPFSVPGKVALWLEDAKAGANFGTTAEDTVALKVTDDATGATFFYVPACAEMTPDLRRRLQGAALVFFDGTLWRDDEMVRAGLGQKTGQRMGHMSMSGPAGSIAAFDGLGVKRRIYIHINNTNPALRDSSDERKAAEAAGWEISYDGMELTL